MNRVILISCLVIGMMASAQTNQIITRKLQLNNVPVSLNDGDKILVRGEADKVVKEIPRSSVAGISEAPIDGQNYVRNNGSWLVAPSGSNSLDLQAVVNNGNSVAVNRLTDNSYFDFSTSGVVGDNKRIKAGYDGLWIGSGYNNNSERFTNFTKYSITFGNGMDSIILGADVLNIAGGGIRYVTIPATSGKVVLVNTKAPVSPTDIGIVGEIRVSENYVYYCIAPNQWVRNTVSTW